MNTTELSTAANDIETQRRLGSVMWVTEKALRDELCELRAKHQRQQQQGPVMAQAKKGLAEQRHQALIAAVTAICQEQDTDRPLSRMPSGQRLSVVMHRLKETPTAYGLPENWKPSNKKERVVRKVLKSWLKSDS